VTEACVQIYIFDFQYQSRASEDARNFKYMVCIKLHQKKQNLDF